MSLRVCVAVLAGRGTIEGGDVRNPEPGMAFQGGLGRELSNGTALDCGWAHRGVGACLSPTPGRAGSFCRRAGGPGSGGLCRSNASATVDPQSPSYPDFTESKIRAHLAHLGRVALEMCTKPREKSPFVDPDICAP